MKSKQTKSKILIYDNKTHNWEVVSIESPLAREYKDARVTNLKQYSVVWVGAKKTKLIKIKDFFKGKMEVSDL